MAKCVRCGKKSVFLKTDSSGLCPSCVDLDKIEKEIADKTAALNELKKRLEDEENTYNQLVEKAKNDALEQLADAINTADAVVREKTVVIERLSRNEKLALEAMNKATAEFKAQENKLIRAKEVLKGLIYSSHFFDETRNSADELVTAAEELLSPTVVMQFNCMNVRDLRKEFTKNQKLINATLDKYKGRYTTKANQAIYRLMVIALEAELQNTLYSIGYGKLDKAKDNIRKITSKYKSIAIDGNQTIAPTVNTFIGEVEYFFLRAVEIEYEYFVQKERARDEQRALREQMRQEAQEKKELERQKKHIEKEEQKYNDELSAVQTMLSEEKDSSRILQLEARILKLQEQLGAVQHTKADILRLQMGKAGNVYIISNLGSFGESIFKIGMTRRLDPMDRVKELGDASVPFPFDVHSFVFSDDAVGLERSLHEQLNDRRLNKVNRRKEFFTVSVDELEELVYELEPTAEFNRTMLAEQYNQSLSIDSLPIDFNAFIVDDDDEDEAADDNDE